jgi:transcriptional regulator with XRE-family HTH domain
MELHGDKIAIPGLEMLIANLLSLGMKELAGDLVRSARAVAGLSQRELARKAGTAQSVVARVELGENSPSWETLMRLIRAAGCTLRAHVEPVRLMDQSLLDDVPRILRMTPEARLEEVARVSRFVAEARRV